MTKLPEAAPGRHASRRPGVAYCGPSPGRQSAVGPAVSRVTVPPGRHWREMDPDAKLQWSSHVLPFNHRNRIIQPAVRRLMGQFFRGRGGDDGARLEKELDVLEEQVRTATPGYETQFLNRAGNLCVDAGQPSRALHYYGRAIDAYLESGRFSAAEVLCRKVQQIAPKAVRVRCTIAWLALGKGANDNTREEISGYVEAALASSQEALASKQLVMMAQATNELGLREEIARHLLELGATEEADHVFGLIFQERNGLRPPAEADQGKLWAKLLRAALMGPKELEERSWTKLEEENDALPSLPQKGLP